MLRALLVDDSLGSIETLEVLLKEFCPQVEIIGKAENLEKAYELLLRLSPNLLFLDIEMPLGTGFDLIKKGKNIYYEVIFVTAHKEYALEAIKHKALDYLLKPISHLSLMEAVKKAEDRVQEHKLLHQKSQISSGHKPKQNKLAIPTQKGIELFDLAKIRFFEADGAYTHVHTFDKKVLVSLRLGKIEERLLGSSFFRIHRSFLINLNEVVQYIRGDGGYAVMTNGAKLPITRNKKEQFLEVFHASSL